MWVSGTVHSYLMVGGAMQDLGLRILNDIVWQKPCPPPNLGRRCFTHSTEILLWATKGGDRHTFNYDDMRSQNGGKQMKNVWTMNIPGRGEKCHGRHPTQKPVELVKRCLEASTNPGDLILDPFAGSGTTGIAALQLKRRFVGCEMGADHASLAVKRLSEISDRSAN
jgi:site-specific DNA-methyltransferase (adenine-specific)